MARLSKAQWTTLKLVLIFTLGILVWIPTLMIGLLVEERSGRRNEAMCEVSATWGGAQTLYGPVLVIPADVLKTTTVDGQERTTRSRRHAFVLPESLQIEGEMQPELRNRAIYEVVLHRSTLRLSGYFSGAELASWTPENTTLHWDQAMLGFGISDLRGLADIPAVSFAEQTPSVDPVQLPGPFGGGLVAELLLDHATLPSTDFPFTIELELKGSGPLSLLPLGRRTVAGLSSSWANPSFAGAALPNERQLSDSGFEASWTLLSLNRDYPQRWLESTRDAAEALRRALDRSAFSVELLFPVDSYQKVHRSVKYAVLFTLVTFIGFFVVEHDARASIHPLQYVIIAFGLCVFYALLLSLSELMGFGLAYGLAAGALVLMVAAYLRAVLGQTGRALAAGAVLTGVYSSLYAMLQLQELALLLGSLFLLAVVGALMVLTRRLNSAAEPSARADAGAATPA